MKVKHFLFAFAATIMAACTNETNELQKTEGDFQVFGEVLIDGKPADLSRASGGSWSGLGKYRGKDYATVSYTAPSGFTVTEIREEPDKTSSSSSSHSFDINNKDHTVYVDLDEIAKEYTITVSAGTGGSVSPTSFSGPSGTKRTITATPQSGFTFSSWSASGVSLSSSTSASTTATIGSSNGTITANFKSTTPPATKVYSNVEVIPLNITDYMSGTGSYRVRIWLNKNGGIDAYGGWIFGSTFSTCTVTVTVGSSSTVYAYLTSSSEYITTITKSTSSQYPGLTPSSLNASVKSITVDGEGTNRLGTEYKGFRF